MFHSVFTSQTASTCTLYIHVCNESQKQNGTPIEWCITHGQTLVSQPRPHPHGRGSGKMLLTALCSRNVNYAWYPWQPSKRVLKRKVNVTKFLKKKN